MAFVLLAVVLVAYGAAQWHDHTDSPFALWVSGLTGLLFWSGFIGYFLLSFL